MAIYDNIFSTVPGMVAFGNMLRCSFICTKCIQISYWMEQ